MTLAPPRRRSRRLAAAAALVVLAPAAAAPFPHVGRIERLDPRLDALIAPGTPVERIADGLGWTEGPLWDDRRQALLFSDVPRNLILRWQAATGVVSFLRASGYTGRAPFTGREPGSNGLAFDRAGRLVLCQHGDRALARLEADGRLTVLADRYRGRRLNSPNDVVLHSSGDLYFTDPPFGLPGGFDDPARELPFQGVYRLAPSGALAAVATSVHAPNGIAFAPDERTLYVSNAEAARPVWMAFPVYPDGTLGAGRELAEARAWVGAGEGNPDGLDVDERGHLFAAGPGGVHVLAPDGTRLGRIVTGVPAGNVTWGDDGATLYVAANHWLLRVRTRTRGATGPLSGGAPR